MSRRARSGPRAAALDPLHALQIPKGTGEKRVFGSWQGRPPLTGDPTGDLAGIHRGGTETLQSQCVTQILGLFCEAKGPSGCPANRRVMRSLQRGARSERVNSVTRLPGCSSR